MTENNRYRKIFLVGGAVLLFLCVLARITITRCGRSMEAVISDLVAESVSSKIDTAISEMDLSFQRVRSELHTLDHLEVEELGDAMIKQVLVSAVNSSDAYQILYCRADGTALNQRGDDILLSDLSYYEDLKDAEDGCYYVEDDELVGQSAMIYLHRSEAGMYLAYISSQIVGNALDRTDAAEYIFYAVLNREHNIVISGGTLGQHVFLEGDLWTNIKDGASTMAKWSVFYQKAESGKRAEVDSTKDGETIHFFAKPMGNTSWTLIVGLDDEYSLAYQSQMLTSIRRMKVIISLILTAILGGYIAIWLLVEYRAKENQKRMEGKADTDQLTGLSNKIATELLIKEYMREFPNSQGVFILIDVDNFKKINDTMGHAFGDEVLRNLGIRLRSLYRMNDIIGRLGGDEFCVFLKDIRDEEIIRRESAKLLTFFRGFEVGEYVKYSVTASMGAAIFPSEGMSFEDLYKNADSALYHAKRGGKNQLIFYADSKGLPMPDAKKKEEKKEEE